MELYEYARPEVMAGKKILYLHGFASSGQNGTARTLRTLLPQTEIISPDIPEEPAEALDMLRSLCGEMHPDLIVGTSMGAMYGEQMTGYYKILVNPAFQLADTLLKNNGLGRHEYHNPRQNGETSILITKTLLEAFRECSSHCFESCVEDRNKVYGLFGIHDNMVHTFDLFEEHYPYAIRFDGDHYLNDRIVLHSLLPLIQRIDDLQEGRVRKTILFSIEDTLADSAKAGQAFADIEAKTGAVKAFRKLSEAYDCHILCSARYNYPQEWADNVSWVEKKLGVYAWDKIIISNRKDMIIGDYLIDSHPHRHKIEDFMGTVIEFGSETFKNWEDVIAFFERLGGQ